MRKGGAESEQTTRYATGGAPSDFSQSDADSASSADYLRPSATQRERDRALGAVEHQHGGLFGSGEGSSAASGSTSTQRQQQITTDYSGSKPFLGLPTKRPEVGFGLLVAIFFGAIVQLLGFNAQLLVAHFLEASVFPSSSWGSLQTFPYSGSAVLGSFMSLFCLNAMRLKNSQKQKKRRSGQDHRSGTGETEHQSKSQQPSFFATHLLKFHTMFLASLVVLTLSYQPLMSLAISNKTMSLAIVSLCLNGFAQTMLAAILTSLCAALEDPRAMVAYNLGNAAAAWPNAIFGITFVSQTAFQPSVVFSQVIFAVITGLTVVYYLFYWTTLKPYTDSTMDSVSPANESRESLASLQGDEDASIASGSSSPLHSARSADNNYGTAAAITSQQIELAGRKDDFKTRSFWQIVTSSWTLVAAMFLQFVGTFIVFPGALLKWKPVENTSLTLEQQWQVLLAIFTVFDTVGRYTPRLVDIPARFLLLTVFARIAVMIPVMILMTYLAAGLAAQIIVVIVFATTQGHLTTNIFIRSGEYALGYRELAVLGPVMNSALMIGILIGSSIQFGMASCLPNHNTSPTAAGGSQGVAFAP